VNAFSNAFSVSCLCLGTKLKQESNWINDKPFPDVRIDNLYYSSELKLEVTKFLFHMYIPSNVFCKKFIVSCVLIVHLLDKTRKKIYIYHF